MKQLFFGLFVMLIVPVSGLTTELAIVSGSPKDPAVVNHERILYWLEKNAELNKNATAAEKQAALKSYLQGVGKHSHHQPKIVKNTLKKQRLAYKQGKSLAYKNTQETTVKVLAVLIDFPDLKHDSHGLSSSDTEMYYSNYPVSHYQDLMFSQTGFTGPNGENLTSAYQYYQNESGGSFYFTGQTYGWVTADNNAAYYGANESGDNNSDQNVPALVKEAVSKVVQSNNINLSEYDVEDPYDLDKDGNTNEPDGLIDHVMVYHSSIGEEAGGGVLGGDAIWSHRYYVDSATGGYQLAGSDKKVFGYTIQPIDAATGVVVHEFGHDLGVPDEYDIGDSDAGSPVGYWSIMAGGSWAGKIAGTEPTGFSPYAKAFFQSVYGGNWINEQVIDFTQLEGDQNIQLAEAVNHEQMNQLRIDLPEPRIDFAAPYSGNYQYYSNGGHDLNNSLSFTVYVPASGVTEMSIKAHWDIEVDYDYAQVLVNGVAIEGNYTQLNNSQHREVSHFITGKSADISGAEGALGWVDLRFDLSAYADQSISVVIQYVTDEAVQRYGMVIDDLSLNNSQDNNDRQIYFDGAEKAGATSLDGFLRIDDTKPGEAQNYWVQLRSENEQDSGLADSVYTPGVLIWFADEAYTDNKVGEHPGHGFIGVVDTDQNPIMVNGSVAQSSLQVIDAALGLYSQKSYQGDSHLAAEPVFDDSRDYSFPEQPESGLVLPVNNLRIEVLEQATDSSKATVKISKASASIQTNLMADFDYNVKQTDVSFNSSVSGGCEHYRYTWDFGDGQTSTVESPEHSYDKAGDYTVKLTVTDDDGSEDVVTKTVQIQSSSSTNNTTSGSTSGGSGGGGSSNLWLLLLLGSGVLLRRKR
ncbi:immune inhibitor A domain-containing protein [Kangiella shandongensis]|uniref:immune inhibitor A domain-containing protein n=1 Tax=Kangiella shandongensis TaxID=2763258 RepID=UPI001CC17616|nr:immune inhibitor A domain-containing protein [Kangiella shandongensis]